MEPILRTTIAQKVAEALLKEIQAGRWDHHLPGYRGLAAQLGVGRRAMDGALAILTAQGILEQPDSRCRRVIIPSAVPAPATTLRRVRFLYTASVQEPDPTESGILMGLRRILPSGWDLDRLPCAAFDSARPAVRLKTITEDYPHTKWVLVYPPHPVAAWGAASGLDVICIGGETLGLPIPCLTTNFTDICCMMAREALTLGHRRLCILTWPTSANARARFVRTLTQCYSDYGLDFQPDYNAPTVSDADEPLLWRTYEAIFRYTPPTAIIVHSFEAYLSLSSFCIQKKIRIPEDLSVLIADDSPLMKWIRPCPAHIKWPVAAFVQHLSRWILKGPASIPPGLHVLPASFVSSPALAAPSGLRQSAHASSGSESAAAARDQSGRKSDRGR